MTSKMALGLLIAVLVTATWITEAQGLKNVECSIQPELVEVDPGHYRVFPIMVRLMRCRGVVGSIQPDVKRCVPTEKENITLTVFNEKAIMFINVTVVNHTKCGSKCVKEEKDCSELETYEKRSCKCNCKYNSEPRKDYCKEVHSDKFIWRQSKCGCECEFNAAAQRCSYTKEWSHEHCQCRCRQKYFDSCALLGRPIDTKSCSCAESPFRNATVLARSGDENNISRRMLAVALIIELLIVVIIGILIYYYCLRDKDSKGDRKAKFQKFLLFNGKHKEVTQSFDNRGDELDEEQKLKLKAAYLEDRSDDSVLDAAVDHPGIMEVDGIQPAYLSGHTPSTSVASSHCALRTDSELETTGDGWVVSPATMV